MKISIGADHAGFEYKKKVIGLLTGMGISVVDHGTHGIDSVDYPDFIHPVADDLSNVDFNFGIVICGSGNGVAITANKHQHIRAALCWNIEVAQLARLHNNANVIAIPARFVSENLALEMVKVFLKTKFEAGRHQRRVDKITVR